MVWFYFVISWCEADAVERPLFNVFVARDLVPALEIFVVVGWNPVELELTVFVAVDRAVLRVGLGVSEDNSFGIERDVCLELLRTFVV